MNKVAAESVAQSLSWCDMVGRLAGKLFMNCYLIRAAVLDEHRTECAGAIYIHSISRCWYNMPKK